MARSFRLAEAPSPYLRDHAIQPIEWYPWGEEARNKALSQRKPLFISIGYSTCHWCHRMAREVFNDEEVGRVLSEYFVPIKVDRELHPAVDEVYMSACLTVNGQGGWPLNVFATPEGKPFYFFTYAPKEAFLGLLFRLKDLWLQKSERLLEVAEELARRTERSLSPEKGEIQASILTEKALKVFEEIYDPLYGGFGLGAKFPSVPILYFLFSQAQKGKRNAQKMLRETLYRMALSGLRDHIGGGFFRYTVDRGWTHPHYEKMLYDQAQLLEIYALYLTQEDSPLFREVLEETVEYLFREMRSPEGLFYTAQDAESPEGEGAFYLFTRKELQKVFKNQAQKVAEIFHIEDNPSLPYLTQIPEPNPSLFKKALFETRRKRLPPRVDEKILCGENALLLSALIKTAKILSSSRLIEASLGLYHKIKIHFCKGEDIYRVFYQGKRYLPGLLEDYARLTRAALDLYDVTGKKEFLIEARRLSRMMNERLEDPENGAFWASPPDPCLFLRPKEIYDRAWPSGNALAYEGLLRLAIHFPEEKERAMGLLKALGGSVKRNPESFPYLLALLAGEV